MYNPLPMYVPQGAGKLGHPEADGIFRESLSRDVETKVAAIHEINDKISAHSYQPGAWLGFLCRGAIQVLDILKAVAQIAKEWMVQMFQHSPLANDIPDAF